MSKKTISREKNEHFNNSLINCLNKVDYYLDNIEKYYSFPTFCIGALLSLESLTLYWSWHLLTAANIAQFAIGTVLAGLAYYFIILRANPGLYQQKKFWLYLVAGIITGTGAAIIIF